MKHRVMFLSQRGLSLISLMMGLLISMITILACLVAYKNLVHVSADNKIYTAFDGKISLATLVLEKSVQAAGFGMGDPTLADLKIKDTGTTRQIFWRYKNLSDSSIECEGFEETTTTDTDGNDFREVHLLTATSGCDETSALAGMTWGVSEVLARWKMGDDEITQYIQDNNSLFEFSVDTEECSPFGQQLAEDAENHYVLNVTAPDAAYLFNANVPLTEFRICLYNFNPG